MNFLRVCYNSSMLEMRSNHVAAAEGMAMIGQELSDWRMQRRQRLREMRQPFGPVVGTVFELAREKCGFLPFSNSNTGFAGAVGARPHENHPSRV